MRNSNYNGIEQDYDALKNVLKTNQNIYMGMNTDGTDFEYVVIKDPYDDSFGTYTECIIMDDSTTSSKIEKKQILTDKGILLLPDSLWARLT